MTELLLDLGNTQLKVALAEQHQLGVVTQGEDLAALLDGVSERPEQIWLSSVAGKTKTQALLALLAARWDAPIQQVSVAHYQQYLPTAYAVDQLGVDRWLAMLACCQICQQACLVVDCGTAITLDLVDLNGQHAGGYILPGLHMMQEALLGKTHIPWPAQNTATPIDGLAKDTHSAVQTGSQQAVVALIENMLKQTPHDTMLFIGGGGADKIGALLTTPYTQIQQMVIHGLAQLAVLEET